MAEVDRDDHAIVAQLEPRRELLAEADVLVGRDRELDQLVRHFPESHEHARPALVIVSGPTGIGKSALLKRAQALAAARGWHVAPVDASDDLCITPSTTEAAFSDRVRRLLGIHDLSQESVDRVERLRTGDAAAEEARHPLGQLADQLAQQPPTVLLVEGYQPSSAFATAFEEALLVKLRSTRTPVVLVVADESGNVDVLARLADEKIMLGPLDSGAVRQHFEHLAVQPPIGDEELSHYVKESCARPTLIRSLTRVLQLAQEPGP